MLDNISDILNSSILPQAARDDSFNPVEIYKLESSLLHYFNRLQTTIQAEKTILFLYKNSKNYSNFLFYKEIESIVNSVSNEFGRDINGRFLYNEKIENKEIQQENWQGRYWEIKHYSIALNYKDNPFHIVLEITISNI